MSSTATTLGRSCMIGRGFRSCHSAVTTSSGGSKLGKVFAVPSRCHFHRTAVAPTTTAVVSSLSWQQQQQQQQQQYNHHHHHHDQSRWFVSKTGSNYDPSKRKKRFVPASEPAPGRRGGLPDDAAAARDPEEELLSSFSSRTRRNQTPSSSSSTALEQARPVLKRIPRAMEGLSISFVEQVPLRPGLPRRSIDCLGMFMSTIGNIDYLVGLPIDVPVTLCFDQGKEMIPIYCDNEEVMKDLFPVAAQVVKEAARIELQYEANAAEDEENRINNKTNTNTTNKNNLMKPHASLSGQKVELKQTPLSLTLAGLPHEDITESSMYKHDIPLEERPEEKHADVVVLLQFEHNGKGYCLVKYEQPFLVVGKTPTNSSHQTCAILTPEEAEIINPILDSAPTEELTQADVLRFEQELAEMKSQPFDNDENAYYNDDTDINEPKISSKTYQEMDDFVNRIKEDPAWAEELYKKAKREMPHSPSPDIQDEDGVHYSQKE